MTPLVSFNEDTILVAEEVDRFRGQIAPRQNRFLCLEFRGRLCYNKLNEALRAIIGCHPALSSAFGPNKGVDTIERRSRLAVFADQGLTFPGLYRRLPLPEDRSSTVGPAGNQWPLDKKSRHSLIDDIISPFDYSRPPLLRARLFRVDESKHLLVLILPVIVCDVLSLRILYRDLAAFYGHPSEFLTKPNRLPFDEFVEQQHLRVQTGAFDADVRYWGEQRSRRRFEQDICRRPYVDGNLERFNRWSCTLQVRVTKTITARVRRFAAIRNVGVDSLVLAAFCMRLGCANGHDQVFLSIDFPNRQTAASRTIIGGLSNSHQSTIDVPQGTGADSLAESVNVMLREGELHQAVPEQFVHNRLGRLRQPPASVSFGFVSATELSRTATADGVRIKPAPLPDINLLPSTAELRLFGWDNNEELTLAITYPKAIASETMEQFLNSLCGALQELSR